MNLKVATTMDRLQQIALYEPSQSRLLASLTTAPPSNTASKSFKNTLGNPTRANRIGQGSEFLQRIMVGIGQGEFEIKRVSGAFFCYKGFPASQNSAGPERLSHRDSIPQGGVGGKLLLLTCYILF